jgi:hypothetical protein
VSELEDYVGETYVSDIESGVGDVDSRLSDVEGTVGSICDEFSYSSISALNDIYFAAC